jgi:three-Cys-motif partner protein
MSEQEGGEVHTFGGQWTEDKLQILAKYLEAYTTALSKTRFLIGYIDAFAGARYWTSKQAVARAESKREREHNQISLDLTDDDLGGDDSQRLRKGSAMRALQVSPRFGRYIFIEKNSKRVSDLEKMRQGSEYSADIQVLGGDGNDALLLLCQKDWASRRAVLFLDPYGMTVNWDTIEAVAHTKAIDMWLLFPLGSALNRMLTKSGDIPESWEQKLNAFLGTDKWRDAFYLPAAQGSLFGQAPDERVKISLNKIGEYFVARLKTAFPHVAKPGVLRNSNGAPLFLLCFAAGNEKGGKIALKIAEHLLKHHR